MTPLILGDPSQNKAGFRRLLLRGGHPDYIAQGTGLECVSPIPCPGR